MPVFVCLGPWVTPHQFVLWGGRGALQTNCGHFTPTCLTPSKTPGHQGLGEHPLIGTMSYVLSHMAPARKNAVLEAPLEKDNLCLFSPGLCPCVPCSLLILICILSLK